MEEFADSNDKEEELFKRSKSKSRGPNKPDNFKRIKMKILEFKGGSNPEAYLEWDSKIEMVFACQNYTDKEKVKLAVI